jgi:hypothetical protein
MIEYFVPSNRLCRLIKFLDSNRAQNWIDARARKFLLAPDDPSAQFLVTEFKGMLSKVTECISHIATINLGE